MTEPLTVIGTPVSPYVRKVLAVLELKGLSWRIDPLVPFLGNDAFTRPRGQIVGRGFPRHGAV